MSRGGYRNISHGTGARQGYSFSGYTIAQNGNVYPYVHRHYSNFLQSGANTCSEYYKQTAKNNFKILIDKYKAKLVDGININKDFIQLLKKIGIDEAGYGNVAEAIYQDLYTELSNGLNSTSLISGADGLTSIIHKARELGLEVAKAEKDITSFCREYIELVDKGLSLLNNSSELMIFRGILKEKNLIALEKELASISNNGTYSNGVFTSSDIISTATFLNTLVANANSNNVKYFTNVQSTGGTTSNIFHLNIGENLIAECLTNIIGSKVNPSFEELKKILNTNNANISWSLADGGMFEQLKVQSKGETKAHKIDILGKVGLSINVNGENANIVIDTNISNKLVNLGVAKTLKPIHIESGTSVDNLNFLFNVSMKHLSYVYTSFIDPEAKNENLIMQYYVFSTMADQFLTGGSYENAQFIVINGQIFLSSEILQAIYESFEMGAPIGVFKLQGIAKLRAIHNQAKNAQFPNWNTAFSRSQRNDEVLKSKISGVAEMHQAKLFSMLK